MQQPPAPPPGGAPGSAAATLQQTSPQQPASAAAHPDTPLLSHFPPLARNRNFLLLWLGYVVSALGDRIHFLVVLELLCIRLLHQGRYPVQQTAQLNIVMFLPFFLLGPLAGLVADCFPRRAVMVTADLVRVALVFVARTVLLAGALAAHPDVPLLVLLLFVSEFIVFIFGAAFSPARTALLPGLVHPNQLLRANALTNAAGVCASLAGYALGALLIHVSIMFAIYADAAAYLLSAGSILLMRPRPGADARRGGWHWKKVAGDARLAWNYLRTHRRPMQIIVLELLFWMASMIVLNSVPAVVSGTFHMGHDLGYFMALSGAGMVVSSIMLSIIRGGLPKEISIGWALAGMGVALAMLGLARHWPFFLLCMIAGSFAGGIVLITLETLLQRIVPDFVRGRVLGVRDLVTNGGMIAVAAPFALAGPLGGAVGWSMLGAGVALAAIAVALLAGYYKTQTLPVPVAIARRLAAAYLRLVHRFQRQGACTIPGEGPVIVIANHTSAVDPLTIQAGSRRRLIHFMMAREYFALPVLHWLFEYLGCIPVNRSGTDIASLRTALRVLKEGQVLGVFPEGRISLDGRLQSLRPGTAVLALKSGATVVPAHISGARGHQSVWRDLLLPARLRIRFGRPMRFDQYRGQEHDRAVLEAVTEEMARGIEQLQPEGARPGALSALPASE